MNRADFIKIIKLRSEWKIDRRKGNYSLPSGQTLRDYVGKLVYSQMQLDEIGIDSSGKIVDCVHPKILGGNFILFKAFYADEICSFDEMQKRLDALVREIIGM